MKPAHILWQELNRNKYRCETCNFRSSNAAHMVRHLNSSKHFLLEIFAKECPNDLKILVASFLPLYKLFRIPGRNGRLALKLAWQRPYQFHYHPRVVLPFLTFGRLAFSPVVGPRAPNADEEDPPEYIERNPAFWISLQQHGRPLRTNVVWETAVSLHQSSAISPMRL